MNIRKFKKEDATLVSEVIWTALDINNSKDYGQDVLLTMKKEYTSKHICLLSKSRIFLVAEYGGKITGVGGIEEDFICSVFVDPKKQGKGIGRLIMNALESIAKKKKYDLVFLHSSLTAESFYAKIGYCFEKRVVDPLYGENIMMKKIL
jgi:GNAT superfamily N-acetyltransferase